MEQQKNWFMRHKVITGFLIFIAFIFLITIFSSNKEPTRIEEINTNQPTATKTAYIIEVTGTGGLEFTGSIGGGANQKSIQGSVPANYEVSDWPAVAVIQKKGTSGTLTVTITKNGRVLNTQTTDADYGVVTVSSG